MFAVSRFLFQERICLKEIYAFRKCSSQGKKALRNDSKKIFKALINGDRGSLARGITLVESTHIDDIGEANKLLGCVLQYLKNPLKNNKQTFRIGLTGAPGAGKSSLIETFGKKLTKEGHKVAVLAIDPSSVKTGGSLLGDRTRMTELARDPNAFIRPSPASGTLGGVARKTNEALVLCEGAGYNIILIETVGIGQSEFAVKDMVDMFVLVIPPAAGDELQGIKKGIVEMADLVLVNKTDGDLKPAAKRIQAEYTSALKLLRRPSDVWRPRVYPVSALYNEGFEKVWWKMQQFREVMIKNETFHLKRKQQYNAWMWNYIEDNIMQSFVSNNSVKLELEKYEKMIENGEITPYMAADALLKIFNTDRS